MIGISRLYVAGALLVAGAALVGGLWGFVAWREAVAERRGADRVQAAWDKAASAAKDVALRQAQEAAQETARRVQEQKEAQDAYQAEIARQRAAAARAGAAADRLRSAATDLASRAPAACPDTATASDSTPAPDAAVVLADVLGRIDARAGELAAHVDAARAAGEQCARAYDSLTR